MAALGTVTAAGSLLQLNAPATGFVFLIVILLVSIWGGLAIGMTSSVVATLCYNFFFLPPLHTFRIDEPANWLALAAFLFASVIASRLVVAVRESAHVEALRESEALKTSLLQAISHDLTTPITTIVIETEALQRRAGGDEALRASANAIAEETERLRRRIGNLLSMARLEGGNAKPHIEPTPPADLFRAVRENLPRVALTVQVDSDCPDADIDPSLALEIVVNLAENAHRVSPPNTPVVLVAKRHPADPRKVRLEILDRGPGMPADLPHRGLGLEIARSLAAANGGSLEFEPREGGGTAARVDFPAALMETVEAP
jgi:two-component system sensor histidine kinase KdpD